MKLQATNVGLNIYHTYTCRLIGPYRLLDHYLSHVDYLQPAIHAVTFCVGIQAVTLRTMYICIVEFYFDSSSVVTVRFHSSYE